MKYFVFFSFLACSFFNLRDFPFPLYRDGVRSPSSLFDRSVQNDLRAFDEIRTTIGRKNYKKALLQIHYFKNHFAHSPHIEKVVFLEFFIAINQKSLSIEILFQNMEKKYAHSFFFHKACLLMSQKYIKENKKRRGELLLRKVLKESEDLSIENDAHHMLESL